MINQNACLTNWNGPSTPQRAPHPQAPLAWSSQAPSLLRFSVHWDTSSQSLVSSTRGAQCLRVRVTTRTDQATVAPCTQQALGRGAWLDAASAGKSWLWGSVP